MRGFRKRFRAGGFFAAKLGLAVGQGLAEFRPRFRRWFGRVEKMIGISTFGEELAFDLVGEVVTELVDVHVEARAGSLGIGATAHAAAAAPGIGADVKRLIAGIVHRGRSPSQVAGLRVGDGRTGKKVEGNAGAGAHAILNIQRA